MESLQPNSISNLLLWRNVSKDSIQFNWDIGQLQRTGKCWKDDEETTLTTNIWTIHGFMCEMVAPPMFFSGPRGPFYNNQRTCLFVRPSVPSFFFNSFPFNAASPHYPRRFPDHPRTFPNHPRMSQNGPISPKNIPSSPQNTPECSQITPRPPQNCHWSHAKRPKITPKCSR